MSSIFKGIKKIFKKIVKTVKKIAPAVLAIGALVFTGGAALGLTGVMGGGWTAAASTIGSTIGGSGLVGTVLSGAITQAGMGALIGGGISAAMGGSFSQGMKKGAAAGAVTGGLLSGVGHMKSAAAAKSATSTPGIDVSATIDPSTGGLMDTASNLDPTQVANVGGNIPSMGGGGGGSITPPAAVSKPGFLSATNVGEHVAENAPGIGNTLKTAGKGLLSWAEKNQELAGGIVKGVGTGLLASANADTEVNYLREQERIRGDNYNTDPGAKYRSAAPSDSGVDPNTRFNPNTYGSFEYRYVEAENRIMRVPVG